MKNINKMFLRRIFVVFIGLPMMIDAQRPDIVDEILPEVKQKNQIGYLNCTVVNKGSESVVQWTKSQTVNGGNPILLSEDDKIVYQGYNQGINEDSGLDKYDVQSRTNGRRITYMLVIRYLAEEDAGDYLCTIKIQGVEWTDWPSKIGKLTVQIAPQIQPSINSAYELDIGSNLQLVCESHGIPSPNITWKREDGQELPMGGFQSRGAQLNLTDIQKNDRGNYICVADNNVKPPDDFKVEVVVFFPPACRPVQSTVGQAQNRRFNAKLECIVAGFPQPSMRWMKETENGKRTEITDDDKYDITKQFSSQLQNDEFWYTLLVKNVQAKDYTKYYCVGTNRYGDGETTIILFETLVSPEGSGCLSDEDVGESTISETGSSTRGLADPSTDILKVDTDTTTDILKVDTDTTTEILEVGTKSNGTRESTASYAIVGAAASVVVMMVITALVV